MKRLSELYRPKPKQEKTFVDISNKPQPVLKKSKPTEDDKMFNATNVKTFSRGTNRFGYDTGADEKTYDGGSSIGVNDQRKEVGIAPYTVKTNEDLERIDELSPKTLKSYVKKASGYGRRSAWGLAQKGETEEDKSMSTNGEKYPEKQERHQKAANQLYRKSNNREKGEQLAKRKLKEHLNPNANASTYIDDFVHSKNSKFAGDSKKERIKRALGAYYGHKNEDVSDVSDDDAIETLFDMIELMMDTDNGS